MAPSLENAEKIDYQPDTVIQLVDKSAHPEPLLLGSRQRTKTI
ncbi:hypothetical protein [Nitrosomonas sp.]|nr:hypothetical protein [Nitrosomonas sp.]